MIFKHTIGKVLSGQKTQTARIWKPFYKGHFDADNNLIHVTMNKNNLRRGSLLYYPGQVLSVQPNPNKKGVAFIKIKQLQFFDVRLYTPDDIAREGFEHFDDFIDLWKTMHKNNFDALVIKFCFAGFN